MGGSPAARGSERWLRERDNARRYHARVLVAARRLKEEAGCALCGYSENGDAMEFDHIDGGGSTRAGGHRARSGKLTWNDLRRIFSPDSGIQVLCGNCHNVKSRETQRAKRVI